ncbi:hypothetical protein [Actinoplanes italicus]|nr:hypothetical protein [Actinoplanes italicus]
MPAPRVSWWRAFFSSPPQPQPAFRHLCQRFTSGEFLKEPYTKVKEGHSLRLRDDGSIEYGWYTLQQDTTASYSGVRAATDEELLLADHSWEIEWSDGPERVLTASRGRLIVNQKGAGLRRILEGLR